MIIFHGDFMISYKDFLGIKTLSETVMTDIRNINTQDDFKQIIQTSYQSLYLHLKSLSNIYLMKGDVQTSRRLMSMASQLASALNQTQQFQFKK